MLSLLHYRHIVIYRVQPLQNLKELSTSLNADLKRQGINFPKTVIFCQTYPDCYQLYMKIQQQSSGAFTFPQDYPDVHKYCLVDLYTRVSTVPMREKVLTLFANPGSTLRLVIATTALAWGWTAEISGKSYIGVFPAMSNNMFKRLEELGVMDYRQRQ